MALHHLGGLGAALNDVGIDGTLSQEVDTIELACFFLEYADELATDNLTLLFGVSHTFQQTEEAVSGIHINKICAKLVAEHFHNVFALSLAHETVVYVNANQILADSLQQKSCNNRAVHAS